MPPTILVVDDEDALRDILARELTAEGYIGVAIEDKAEAYEWCIQNQPDLIISDINSPGLKGFEFLRLLKANPFTKHISFIFLTGFADLKNAIESKKMGADDFVSKPYDLLELLNTVKRVLTGRKQSLHVSLPAVSEAADCSQIPFLPWTTIHTTLGTTLHESGLRAEVLPSSETWTSDFVIDSNRMLSLCRLIRPISSQGISSGELLNFRTLLDDAGLRLGFMFSLSATSRDAEDLAPLLGVILIGEAETMDLLEAGVMGHDSEILHHLAEGSLLQTWQAEHEGLRMFAGKVANEMEGKLGNKFFCTFEENGKGTWGSVSLSRIGSDGLSFKDESGAIRCTVHPLDILKAVSTLWRRGHAVIISRGASIQQAALYKLLARLPSLEGNGMTVYRKNVPRLIQAVQRNRPLIAVLDDEEILREILGMELRSEGYDVITFGFKPEFICHLMDHPDALPDLIISDIMSPAFTGLEFLGWFKSDPRHRHVPVIILSGNIPRRKKEAKRLGAYRCLAKPYNLNHLLSLINRVLARSRTNRFRAHGLQK